MCLPIIRASRRLGQGCSPWAGSLGQVPVGTSPSAMCCPVPRGTLMSTLPTSEGGLKARLAGKAVQTPWGTSCPPCLLHRAHFLRHPLDMWPRHLQRQKPLCGKEKGPCWPNPCFGEEKRVYDASLMALGRGPGTGQHHRLSTGAWLQLTPDKPTGCPEQQVHRSVPHTHVHTNTGARHTRAHPLEPRRPGRSTAINHSNLAGIWEPLCRAHT